jgi:hypothetical protein
MPSFEQNLMAKAVGAQSINDTWIEDAQALLASTSDDAVLKKLLEVANCFALNCNLNCSYECAASLFKLCIAIDAKQKEIAAAAPAA